VRQGLPTRRAQRPAQPGTVCCGVSPTKSPPLTACSTGRRRKSVPLRWRKSVAAGPPTDIRKEASRPGREWGPS